MRNEHLGNEMRVIFLFPVEAKPSSIRRNLDKDKKAILFRFLTFLSGFHLDIF
jgi:hypothetical protein